MERNGTVGNYVCAVYSFVQLRVLLRRDSCRADLAPFVVVSRLGPNMFVRGTHSSNCVLCCAEIVAGLIRPRSLRFLDWAPCCHAQRMEIELVWDIVPMWHW